MNNETKDTSIELNNREDLVVNGETKDEVKNEIVKKETPYFSEDYALTEIEILVEAKETSELLAVPNYILTESGWTPENVGTWDPITRLATLTQSLVENTIEIKTDNVILNGDKDGCSKTVIDGKANKLASGILVNKFSNIEIYNFNIKNCANGIKITNCNKVCISNNSIVTCSPYGIYADFINDLNIHNNYYEGMIYPVYINNNCIDTTICNNDFKNTSYSITINFNNINSKILNNRILLYNSTYNQGRGVQIYSNNFYNEINNNTITISNNSFINLGISYIGILVQNVTNTEINNNIIKITNNTINNSSGSYYSASCYGIYFNSSYSDKSPLKGNKIAIENNTFTGKNLELDCYFYGFYLGSHFLGDLDCSLNEISISNNSFTCTAEVTNYFFLYIRGVYLTSSYNGNSFNNNYINISNNTTALTNIYSNIYLYSIYLYYSINAIFKSNKFISEFNKLSTPSYIYGLYLDYYSSNSLICDNTINLSNNSSPNIFGAYLFRLTLNNYFGGNSISTVSGLGLFIGDTAFNNTFNNNKIVNNSNLGIQINNNCRFNTFTKNTIQNNGKYGIKIYDNNSYNYFEENNILDNGIGLDLAANSSNNSFVCNNFINGDKKNAVNLNQSNSFDKNYWSDWNGVIPYDVNGAVDYNPKLKPLCFSN